MTERKTRAVEEEEEFDVPEIDYVGVLRKVASSRTDDDDAFARSAKELKAYENVAKGTKRRITNQINKYHRGAGGAESKKNEFDDITGYNAFDVVMPPYNLDYLAKLYEASSPHKAAVDAKTSNIAGLGYKWVESPKTKIKIDEFSSDDERNEFRKKLEKKKLQLQERIDTLHEEDDLNETLRKVWVDYETTGNGYIEVGRKVTGEIGYLGHIPAVSMRVRKKRDGFVQIVAAKVVYFRNFGDRETADPVGNDQRPNEVIHIKKYAPSSGYYGVPDVIAALSAVAGNEFSSRFNLDYFENKAVPRHLIILKGARLGSSAEQALMEFFQTDLKGQNHRSLYIPLPADTPTEKVEFKIEPIEAGAQDASFNNFRKANNAEILMAEGVPIGKVSQADGQSLAASRDADKTFKEQKCQPEQRIFEKKLNRIIRQMTDIFLLKLNEMSLTDADTQSKIDERYLKTGKVTRNELRARDGEPGIAKGDEIIDLNAKNEMSEARTNRERDSARSAGASDSDGEARQPKGDGRAVA